MIALSDAFYQMLCDELDLDGEPNHNLASFVNTYMEPSATHLMSENPSKDLAGYGEYPAMVAIHERCISILTRILGALERVGTRLDPLQLVLLKLFTQVVLP
ncbi:hypothetical protein SCAR479_09888 [Seiridium cardinale]|uniref:Uncharacterized protein n=1 Tax=Seiridium cardinale TaxID=138064 RepID=A0ABR2XHQ6_9PEZI